MKRVFVVLTIVLVVGMLSTAFAISKFPDTIGTRYDTAVEKLTGKNVITGYPDGTFKPENSVTRAEMSKMMVEALGLKEVTQIALFQFPDVNNSHWAYSWIRIAYQNGIVKGDYAGTFRPDDTVSFAEVSAMVLRSLDLEKNMIDKKWPTAYINEATAQGFLNDVVFSDPNAAAPRGEVAIALYNMTNKIDKKKQEEELAKAEADRIAKEEAEKNAMDFGIVASTSTSKDDYIVKLDGDKNKYELYSISGKTSLTDSKVEALEGAVIGYKDGNKGMEVKVSYTPSSFDKATVISKVSDNIIAFKDKTTWDISSNTLTDKYKYYTCIRVTADYDEDENDGEIYFEDVKELGLGLSTVKFAKGERVLIDTDYKVIIFLKGIDASAVIKKGKITEGAEDTSSYLYGWVSSVTTKNKVDYVKIGKNTYEVYSKSDDFSEDTFVVYEIYKEGNDYDIVELVEEYGPGDLDGTAKIVTAVSGSKAGSQKVTFRGSSTTTDFYNTTNTKKYKDYQVVTIEVKEDKQGYVVVSDYEIEDSLSDVKFAKGDRVVIDTSKEVFVVFQGLSEEDTYKNGKFNGEYEEEIYYTLTFKWKDNKALTGVSLPKGGSYKSGTSVKFTLPTKEGYTITADKTSPVSITKDTTVTLSWEENLTDLQKAERAVQEAQAAVDAAQAEYDSAVTALADAEDERDSKKDYMDEKKEELDEASGDKAELYETWQDLLEEWEDMESGDAKNAKKEEVDEAEEDYRDAVNEYNTATRRYNGAYTDYNAAVAEVTKCQNAVSAAETKLQNAQETLRQKQEELANLQGSN